LGDTLVVARPSLGREVDSRGPALHVLGVPLADGHVLCAEPAQSIQVRIRFDLLERRGRITRKFPGHAVARILLVVIAASHHVKEANSMITNGAKEWGEDPLADGVGPRDVLHRAVPSWIILALSAVPGVHH